MACRHLFLCLFFLFLSTYHISAIQLKPVNLKPVNLHFYLQSTLSGSNPTSVTITKGSIALPGTPFNFGNLNVFDSPLTEDPSPTSNLVGRAQGMFAVMRTQPSVLWACNLVFTSGEYNGSTLAILANDLVTSPERELSVVGGTGKFRMARGYVMLKTNNLDNTSGDVVLEFDVYVYPADTLFL